MHLRIFSYIKDEVHLIKKWLDHHGTIVPWWGIHVYDNESTDGTYEILQEYKEKYSINVYTHDDFKSKGDVITESIRMYNKQTGISIPLDADEFLALQPTANSGIITEGVQIQNYLKSVYDGGEIYAIKGWLDAVPEKENYTDPVSNIDKFVWSGTDRAMCKKIVKNESFKSIDLGFHHATSQNGKITDVDIVYIHYHNTGRERRLSRCIEIINKHGINIDLLDKRNNEPINGSFDGVGRANEYINRDKWVYAPTDQFDVKITPGWV